MSKSEQANGKSGFMSDADKNPSNIMPEKLTLNSYLKFECHPGVPCFTACCHNINIILTPYDILVLSKKLDMEGHEFITQYTEPVYLDKTDMPGVKLKLVGDEKACPFVTPDGCKVYNERPTACRYYPVGMADFHEAGEDGGKSEKFFFLVKEPHCKGFDEDKEWTIGEWRADQGVDKRDEMNKEWLRLIMRRKSFGPQASMSEAAKRMFFMASTDIGSFRRFIFESSFLDTYEIDQETIDKIKEDDVELLLFSYKYLGNVLFGVEGLDINKEKIKQKVAEMEKNKEKTMQEAEKEFLELKAIRDKMKEDKSN